MLSACKESKSADEESRYDALMTEYSERRTVTASENGVKQYQFYAPLLEGYTAGKEPYREFRKGIRMKTFKKDSSGEVDVTLTANYAIYYENRKLWEAKGNVVVKKFDGKELYTEQLFWNDVTNKIYSNVDSKIVEPDGETYVSGFESDEEFRYWSAREVDGKMEMEFTPTPPDSTAMAERDSLEAARNKTMERVEKPKKQSIVPPRPVRPASSGAGKSTSERNIEQKRARDSVMRQRLAAPPRTSTSEKTEERALKPQTLTGGNPSTPVGGKLQPRRQRVQPKKNNEE